MNEYTIHFLNGVISHVLAEDFKDAILEGRLYAERKRMSTSMKYIVDEEGTVIRGINEDLLTYSMGYLYDIIKTTV